MKRKISETKAIPALSAGTIESYEAKRRLVMQLNLTSDIFFSKVMEDRLACEELIQILTGMPFKIREVKSQYSIRHIESHSVILDVLAESPHGRLVNIEMQNSENENHLRRCRYHQSCIDVSMLEKGVPFDKLPELYSIFITQSDFFHLGYGIYHIDRMLREADIPIDSGIHEIYANLEGKVKNRTLQELLHYIQDTDVHYQNDRFPNLIKRVRFYKEEQTGVDIMCEIINALINEGREAAREEGFSLGRKEGLSLGRKLAAKICRLYVEGSPASEISAKLSLDLGQIETVIAEFNRP